MNVLFLDIDGVLNSHAYFLSRVSAAQAAAKADAYALGLEEPPDKEAHARAMIDPAAVEHLNAILDASDAQIVVSSSWRIAYTMGEILRALDANGFRHHRAIIDKTPSRLPSDEVHDGTSVRRAQRGDEIDAWLRGCHEPIEAFAILDDGDDMAMHKPRLVQTSYELGLRQEHVSAVLALLATLERPDAR